MVASVGYHSVVATSPRRCSLGGVRAAGRRGALPEM